MSSPQLEIEFGNRRVTADLNVSHDLSLPLHFDGAQPSFFAAPAAHAMPYIVGNFNGSVATGASCNCSTHTVTPHCNGTHTESLGHIVIDAMPIRDIAPRELLLARVITVTPRAAKDSVDALSSSSRPDDPVIDAQLIRAALPTTATFAALIIRTHPNDRDKTSRNYDNLACPPYFSAAAMQVIVELGVNHLLVDLPSVDRAHDGGVLIAHRVFWGLPVSSTDAKLARRSHATITELCFIDDAVTDGDYLLNLQVAPFMADAAPSRPILYPLRDIVRST